MLKTILGRIVGAHLLQNFKAEAGLGHLQSLIEGWAWRGFVVGCTTLYKINPKFRDGLDQIIAAVTGG